MGILEVFDEHLQSPLHAPLFWIPNFQMEMDTLETEMWEN